jgi:type I restriction enzyme S subunit
VINGHAARPLSELCVLRPPKAEARSRLSASDSVSFIPMEDLGIDAKFTKPSKIRTLKEVDGSYTYFADGDVLLAKITPCFQNGKLSVARGLTKASVSVQANSSYYGQARSSIRSTFTTSCRATISA